MRIPNTYNALVFGSTGAVGSLVITHLAASPHWGLIFLVVRQLTPATQALLANPKYKAIVCPETVNPEQLTQQLNNTRIHAVMNFLGSQTKHGKETFEHVDKTLVVQSCQYARTLVADSFVHITASGANSDSMFYYMKVKNGLTKISTNWNLVEVKGQCEEELKKIELPNLVVYRPGLITDRKDERCGEKFASFVPFLSKIKADDLVTYPSDYVLTMPLTIIGSNHPRLVNPKGKSISNYPKALFLHFVQESRLRGIFESHSTASFSLAAPFLKQCKSADRQKSKFR